MLLLLKFLNPVEGSGDLIIDGVPVKNIRASVLRSRIIALPQTPFLLPEGSTVRSNLVINDRNREFPHDTSVVDEECEYSLSSVGLWPLVEEKGGLDSELSQEALSKGQKQLFCLARAILRARLRRREYDTLAEQNQEQSTLPLGGVLLLDEFTASVDLDTDKIMQTIIRREFENYTVICVTHRLQTIMDYDTVVVMDSGRIVKVGHPSDVVI